MNLLNIKNISLFVLGMLTFAVGSFIVSTFILVERPQQGGIIQDWGQICFTPAEGGISSTVTPKGCFSTTCTKPVLQAGTAVVDSREYKIMLDTNFVIAETSRFPLPCTENCAGGGSLNFDLGPLIPNDYQVWFRDQEVGQLLVFSGRPTPRQCFENPGD
jgi:hypothetical protein